MTGDVAADQARLETLRRCLGAHLATYRRAAGLSQPELGRAIGRTRSMISRIEHGTHALPQELWKITDAELAGELMAVVTKLIRSMGRRDAMRVAGWALAAMGLSGLDADEYARVAQAVQTPRRVDAQVVENLVITLAQCKRLEDKLGPCEVLDIVVAQHQIVRRLLEGGCPDNMIKSLKLMDSNIASTIGNCLINMGHPETAQGYFARARKAGHDAGNPSYAAYAAINTSFAAFLRGDTPTALDTAAAARSLAARTNDTKLKALAEEQAAGAYALEGQYGPCMTACVRAQQFLASENGCAPDSPAYWVHESTLDSKRSTFLSLLDKPKEAVGQQRLVCYRIIRDADPFPEGVERPVLPVGL